MLQDDYASLDRAQLIARVRELEKQTEDFRLLMAQAPDGVFVADAQGRYIDVNDLGARMLGFTRAEILGKSIADIILPEEVPRLAGEIARFGGGAVVTSEWHFPRKDGSTFLGEVVGRQMPDGRLLGILRDITERRRAEDALRKSEERYRRLYDSMRDAFVVVGMDGRIEKCNPAYCKMLGYTQEELSQLSYVDLTPEKWHAVEAGIVASQILPLGSSEVYTKEYRRKDGTVFPVELRAFLIVDDAGQPAQMWAIVRDITNRKRDEQALREAQEFRQTILDAVSTQVAVLDRHGTILEVNANWCRFAKENAEIPDLFPRRSDVGSNYLEVCRTATGVSAEGALQAAEGIQAVLNGQAPHFVQEYPCDAPHEKRWFQMNVTPLNREGGGAVVSHHDISSSRLLAEELRQSEARTRSILRAAPVGIGMIVDRVFHEVNQAMTTMTGYAPEELMGRSSRMLYPTDEDFDYVGHEKYDQIRRYGVGRVITRWRTKDGCVIDVDLSSSPIVPEDLSRGVTFTAQDITFIKQMEQARLAHEASQRNALVREVHHRIKNHLQGVLGLMRNAMVEKPEIAGAMEDIVARIRLIAQVYGLQGMDPNQLVWLVDLMRSAAEGAIGSVPVDCRFPTARQRFMLAQEEAVPMALVINELITNAIKHLGPSNPERPVLASIDVQEGAVVVRVRSGPACLPTGFDFVHGRGLGTGLELLRTLLPPKGAKLAFRQEADEVVAELQLTAPVILPVA